MIANNDPFGSLDSLSDLSASISYARANARDRVTAFGRNMTDERERKVGRIGGLTTRSWYNEGETYGVELAVSL